MTWPSLGHPLGGSLTIPLTNGQCKSGPYQGWASGGEATGHLASKLRRSGFSVRDEPGKDRSAPLWGQRSFRMAQVQIENVLEHLEQGLKAAMDSAIRSTAPNAKIDSGELFRAFVRAVGQRCGWETVRDQDVRTRA